MRGMIGLKMMQTSPDAKHLPVPTHHTFLSLLFLYLSTCIVIENHLLSWHWYGKSSLIKVRALIGVHLPTWNVSQCWASKHKSATYVKGATKEWINAWLQAAPKVRILDLNNLWVITLQPPGSVQPTWMCPVSATVYCYQISNPWNWERGCVTTSVTQPLLDTSLSPTGGSKPDWEKFSWHHGLL